MAADAFEIPIGLGDHLDIYGLEGVDNVERYAVTILATWERANEDQRERFGAFFLRNLEAWLNGECVEGLEGPIPPSEDVMRHAMWMADGLLKKETADKLRDALPGDLRAIVEECVGSFGEWPVD